MTRWIQLRNGQGQRRPPRISHSVSRSCEYKRSRQAFSTCMRSHTNYPTADVEFHKCQEIELWRSARDPASSGAPGGCRQFFGLGFRMFFEQCSFWMLCKTSARHLNRPQHSRLLLVPGLLHSIEITMLTRAARPALRAGATVLARYV